LNYIFFSVFFFSICFQHCRYVELRLRIFGSFQWLLEMCHKNFVSSELKLKRKLSVEKKTKICWTTAIKFYETAAVCSEFKLQWKLSAVIFGVPVSLESQACALVCFFPLFVTNSCADLSGVGLKTAMTISTWCSTPSITNNREMTTF